MRIQHAKLIAVTLFLGAIVGYAFLVKIGPEKLINVVGKANPAYLAIAVAVFLSSYAFGAIGIWHLLGKGTGRGFLLKAHIAGYFLNNITPIAGYGGEIVKAEIIARRTGEPRAKVFAAIIIQKILHFGPFLFAMVLGAAYLAWIDALGKAAFIAGAAGAVAAAFGALIVLFVSRKPGPDHIVCTVLEGLFGFFEKIERRLLPSHVFASARNTVHEFHTIAHSMFWKKSIALPGIFTFLWLASEVATLYFVLLALGQNMALPALFLSYALAVFAGMLPITPGGLGTYDATLAWMLFLFGVPESSAIAASLLFRLIQYWMTNALGIIALARISK